MARHRKQPKKTPIDQNLMGQALELVRGGLSYAKVAKQTGLSGSTVQRYFIAVGKDPNTPLQSHYNTRQVFSAEQEQELTDYVMKCALMFYGLTKQDLKTVVWAYAKQNGMKYPNSWGMREGAGDDWYLGFMKRHGRELSLRTPEGCSLARATSFNRHNVDKFYDNLWALYQRYPTILQNLRIYNLDEKGLVTVQNPKKILAPKGVKQCCKVTSAERGTLVLICCIIGAAGVSLPPAMIFPRVNFKQKMIEGASPGTLGLANKTGWMNVDSFEIVIRHFIARSLSSVLNPSILIFDNHGSHLSPAAVTIAKTNGVHIMTVPPHSTNKLQPLDVAVYGPLQTYYDGALDTWMSHHPGQTFDIYNVAAAAGLAHARAMAPITVMHAFQITGIYPFDRHIFSDADFLPSSVTDRPAPEVVTAPDVGILPPAPDQAPQPPTLGQAEAPVLIQAQEPAPVQLQAPEATQVPQATAPAQPPQAKPSIREMVALKRKRTLKHIPKAAKAARGAPALAISAASTSVIPVVQAPVVPVVQAPVIPAVQAAIAPVAQAPIVLEVTIPINPVAQNVSLATPPTSNAPIPAPSAPKTPSAKTGPVACLWRTPKSANTPSSSTDITPSSQAHYSPEDIFGYPAAGPRKNTQSGRKKGRSFIATDTPEKTEIEERAKERAQNLSKKSKSNKQTKKVMKNLFEVTTQSEDSDAEEDADAIPDSDGVSSSPETFSEDSDNDAPSIDYLPKNGNLAVGSFILVKFSVKNCTFFYVGKITELFNDPTDGNFSVSYLRRSTKLDGKFVYPIIPDTDNPVNQDIFAFLPPPTVNEGTTSRLKNVLSFPVILGNEVR